MIPLNSSRTPDNYPKSSGCVGGGKEMPKLKKLENKLSISDAIVNNMFSGVCLVRAKDGIIVFTNSKFDKLFGYETSELIGKHVSILNLEDKKSNSDRVAQAIMAQIKSAGEATYEVRNVKKDGTPFWCKANTSVFEHPEFGTVFLAVQRDITLEKEFNDRLQKSENQLKLVIETTFDGFWDWHLPTNYEYMSPRFWQILGYDPKEKKHHASEWQEYIFQEDLEAAIKNLDLHIKSKGKYPYHQEARYRHKDGHTVWVICRGTVVEWDENGNAIRMIGTHTDITDLKVAQLALLNSSKMSALGEMAGGVAHEINTPLSIISMKASQLKRLISSDSWDKKTGLEFAEKIENIAFRIAKIVKGLRTFSRDAAKDPLKKVSVKSIIEDTLSLCSERFKNFNVTMIADDIPDDLMIDCRQTQLSQVLLNLITNALDAIIDLPEKWVRIEAYKNYGVVEISVTDSGEGISSDLQDKIMRPFFTTKEVGKGTGLGLSISKGIIESHHGTLELDTKSLKTRFVIRLPEVQAQKVAA